LLALDRREEAGKQALLAYRQAWRDGPPFAAALDLAETRTLLAELGLAEPDLPINESATVPLERDVRAFVDRVT
jgi:hypothetical protein